MSGIRACLLSRRKYFTPSSCCISLYRTRRSRLFLGSTDVRVSASLPTCSPQVTGDPLQILVSYDRENARYVELVESGRSFAKMEERKRKRREDNTGSTHAPPTSDRGAGNLEPEHDAERGVGDAHRRIRRRFKQSTPVSDVGGGSGGMDKSVLRSVFGRSDGTRKKDG